METENRGPNNDSKEAEQTPEQIREFLWEAIGENIKIEADGEKVPYVCCEFVIQMKSNPEVSTVGSGIPCKIDEKCLSIATEVGNISVEIFRIKGVRRIEPPVEEVDKY